MGTPRNSHKHCDGFSLLEITAVLVILGILAATVALRLDAPSQRSATERADEMRRNLSHIQQIALSWGVTLRLTTAANSYTVTCRTVALPNCSSVGATVIDPATGANFTVSLVDGYSSVSLSPVGNSVDIDSLGRPKEPATGLLAATNPARTYTLTGSGRVATVTLLPITGFASTSY